MSVMDYLEDYMYAVPAANRPARKKPMEVLALGLSRSGTDSLRQALQILGYSDVWHGYDMSDPNNSPADGRAWVKLCQRKWPSRRSSSSRPLTSRSDPPITLEDFELILSSRGAVTDVPCAMFAPELIVAYPGAKVILNTRDVESWHRSIMNTFAMHRDLPEYGWVRYFNARLYWLSRFAFDFLHGAYFHNDIQGSGRRIYEEHNDTIRQLVDRERLLEWRVEDGWEPLCRFLNKPIPKEEFPSGNNPAAYLQKQAELKKGHMRRAYLNALVLAVTVTLATASMARRWTRNEPLLRVNVRREDTVLVGAVVVASMVHNWWRGMPLVKLNLLLL